MERFPFLSALMLKDLLSGLRTWASEIKIWIFGDFKTESHVTELSDKKILWSHGNLKVVARLSLDKRQGMMNVWKTFIFQLSLWTLTD